MDFGSVLIGILVSLLLLHFATRGKQKRHPPGPWALPLLGNVLQLDMKPYLTFIKWADKYGPIFAMKMGMDNLIVISDHNLVKELFSEQVASGRLGNPVTLEFTRGRHGIINSEGPNWEKQRRFTLRTLRNLGFAKNSMEPLILEEVRAMLQVFRETKDAPFTGNRLFNAAVVNSLWHIISGKRCEWEVEGAQSGVIAAMESFSDNLMRVTMNGLVFAPVLRFIIPGMMGWNKYCDSIDRLEKFFVEAVEEHKVHLDTQSPQDFIDHMLKEIEETTDPDSVFYKDSGYTNLIASVADLFFAGSETSSHTLSWAMLYLCHHESVQRKVQEEIDSVVGTSRLPCLADRPKMPFSEAVIYEILRLSSVAPIGIPHQMLEDKEFQGYSLSKDSVLMVNQYWIMRDPKVWGDGDAFRPARFLNEDQTKFQPHEAFISFSVGRRTCLGEGIAKDTIFLFVTSILQQFNIAPDPSCNNESFGADDGLMRFPSTFKLIATSRQ